MQSVFFRFDVHVANFAIDFLRFCKANHGFAHRERQIQRRCRLHWPYVVCAVEPMLAPVPHVFVFLPLLQPLT